MINKILLRDPNYIVYVVMLPKFGDSSTFMGEVIISSILKLNKLGLALDMALKFYISGTKGPFEKGVLGLQLY